MYKFQQYSEVIFSLKYVIVMMVTMSSVVATNSFQNQSVFAQNTINTSGTPIDSFRAEGQISSLASDTLAGRENSTENVIWILGGNWEFNVADGNLTNFVVDIDMAQVDGSVAHKHTIERMDNVTGMGFLIGDPLKLDLMTEQPSSKISLVNGNSTMFRGTADLTTNGNIQWTDVPIHVTLQNGNIININVDPVKTEDHFKGLPVFGTVQYIINENGKVLVAK